MKFIPSSWLACLRAVLGWHRPGVIFWCGYLKLFSVISFRRAGWGGSTGNQNCSETQIHFTFFAHTAVAKRILSHLEIFCFAIQGCGGLGHLILF